QARTGLARITRALVAVDEGGHVPGLLVGQAVALAERHVRLDEGRGGVDAGHARAPVVALGAPQRREHRAAVEVALADAVGAVAGGAVGRIDLGAARGVVAQLGLLDLRVPAAFQLGAGRRAGRHPVHVALDVLVDVVAQRRRPARRRILAVHRIGEAALDPVLHGVDPVVLATIFGIPEPGRPYRRGIG